MELHQSPLYEKFLTKLGWKTLIIDGIRIYSRHFPFIGGLAKIQRCETLPNISRTLTLLKDNHVRTVALEPSSTVTDHDLIQWCKIARLQFKINTSPYLATKSIIVDLKDSEDNIFKRFSEAKQRAVRRAKKLGITIIESQSISDLISIKSKSAGLFGSITTYGLREMWSIFAPKNATVLLSYKDRLLVGGVLLIFWKKNAYYWIAGATGYGKKLFAPTLLVWESLKRAKRQGCTQFDLIGAWDERYPKLNTAWHGFTKFKEGFGGKEVYYPFYTQ